MFIIADKLCLPPGRWKAMQRCLPPGVLLLPIMLTQDEATFDGNFRRTLTPIYATLACIRAGGGLQHCHAHKINIVMLYTRLIIY